MKKFVLLHLILFGVLLLRCSQPTQPEYLPPQPPEMISLTGPGSANAPAEIGQKANEVNQWFQYIASLLTGIESETPANQSNVYQWELALDSTEVVRQIKAVRRSDKSVDWTVRLNGMAEDGTLYNNRTVVIGKSGINNTSQSWTLFDLISGEETVKIVWQQDATGTVSLSYILSTLVCEWKMINRIDNSGSYQYILLGVEQFIAQWLASGAGTFIDSSSGVPLSGSWN